MRIAYPIIWDAYSSSGVLAKVENQARIWSERGHEVRVFVVTPPCDGPLCIDESMTTPIIRPFNLFRKFLYLNKISSALSVGMLERHIWKFHPDVIYQRTPLWQSGLLSRLPGIAPYILELNTIAQNERQLLSRDGVFQTFKERLLLGGAAGIVSVSEEISKHYFSGSVPMKVVANGFLVTRFEPRPPPKNKRPQLIFVGSPGMPWHGVDKVIILAEKLPDWDFHLVGPGPSDIALGNLTNVYAYGYLQQSQIGNLYQRMDVGIGTLALHRNNMNEASPLKVREYVAFGLPVISGYHDTDLSGCNFYLNIGNTENNVTKQEDKIRAFVAYWKGRAIDRTKVLQRVDSDAKETRRLEFMAKVMDRNRKASVIK